MEKTSEDLIVQFVDISTIFVGSPRLALSTDVVLELVDSILREGLLHPITITESGRLVSGLHRLAAFKMLGRTHIPALIVPDDELRNEFAEINENLVRNPLTLLQRCELYKRMKELLALENAKIKSEGNNFPTGYSQLIANRIKKTKRHVDSYVEIATLIHPEVKDLIANTHIADKLTDLTILKRVPGDEQKELVNMVSSGRAKSVNHAWRLLHESKRMDVNKGELKQLAEVLKLLAQGPAWAELSLGEVNQVVERFINATDLIRQSLLSLRDLIDLPEKQSKKSPVPQHRRGVEKDNDVSVNQPLLPGTMRIAGS